MLSVPDHPLRLNVFLYISQSPLTSVRSAVQFKLLPWLFLLQEDRNGLPGCMERIQLLLGVSSQKPKRNWLMIGLSMETKQPGNRATQKPRTPGTWNQKTRNQGIQKPKITATQKPRNSQKPRKPKNKPRKPDSPCLLLQASFRPPILYLTFFIHLTHENPFHLFSVYARHSGRRLPTLPT